MSIPADQAVPYPKCGKDIAFTLRQSVIYEVSSAMKDMIKICIK